MTKNIIKSLALPKTGDIRYALYREGVYSHFHTSGHVLPQQGREYVELRNVTFQCDKDYIIDVPEYENLEDLSWYAKNYEPLVVWQLENVIQKLVDDPDTRQAVIQFYDPDKDEKARSNMICTMYVSLRLDKVSAECDSQVMTYTVHMRSSDVRELRSDLRWHKRVMLEISKELSHRLNKDVWCNPIIWYADSQQCWDKDWEFLKDK